MEKDKIPQKQPPQGGQVEHEGSWTSGFESKQTPTAQPPSEPLTANPAEEPRHAEEGEYDPETVVFERGGFADPNHPAEGKGKGIKVVMPPGLDGPAALVHVVMAMMRLTEAEARLMIDKEHMQWTSYVQDGQYLDRMGNAVHVVNFKPKYAERTAHEPATLRPAEGEDLERFKAFKLYLLDHDGDHIRDPYVQYDRWATDAGFFVEAAPPAIGGGTMPGTYNDPAAQDRRNYERDREAVVQYVVWERLRAKRESLAVGIEIDTNEGHEEMKATVQGMADSLPALLDDEQLRQFLPDGYHGAWVALHARMILAQGALEKGDPSLLGDDQLGARIVELGTWLTQHMRDKIVKLHFEFVATVFAMFDEGNVQEALRLTAMQDFGMEQGQALLHIYYKLTFALMQVAGRIISEPGKKVARPVDEADIDLQGKQIENRGKAGAATLGLMHAHPTAQKVSATFYPEQETKDFRQGGEKSEGDDWSDGMALDLFLWHDADAGEWVLEDFSTVDAHKENRAKGAEDAPVPAALFEELNSKLRFPKGALYYRCPDEASYRILRTTEPWTMADWLRMVAMAGLAVGIAVATAGAAIPAQVIMVGSSVFMAGAEVASMVEESEQGMLTTERVVVHGALIASCVLGGATASLKMAGMTGTSVARVVAGLQVGADGVCVAVFSHEAFEGLKAAADDPEGVTFMRLLAFFLQMGMNGLMLYGMKGSMMEVAGGKGSASKPNIHNSENEAAIHRTVGKRKNELSKSLSYYDDTNFDSFARMPEKRMNAWIRYLKSLGVKFEIGTTEAKQILKAENARGLLSRKVIDFETYETELTIILDEDPSIGVFYEESYHALQSIHDIPKYEDLIIGGKTNELVNMWEYGAKTRILHEATRTGLSYEEFIFLEKQIEDVLHGNY